MPDDKPFMPFDKIVYETLINLSDLIFVQHSDGSRTREGWAFAPGDELHIQFKEDGAHIQQTNSVGQVVDVIFWAPETADTLAAF